MVYLFGASGHGLVIQDILFQLGISVAAFIDDADKGSSFGGMPVIHSGLFHPDNGDQLIISVGNNLIRKKISERFSVPFCKAIHPGANLSSDVKIGSGSVVMAGAVINASVTVGNHVIVNTSASIDHECVLGDFVHVSPRSTLCGNVQIGDGAWIGAGATVIQGVRIGANAVVGAGAVVIRDVPEGVVVVGNPARYLRDIYADVK